MPRNISATKTILAAVSLVVIGLPSSTKNLFTLFKRRYDHSQILELNNVSKCRGLRLSVVEGMHVCVFIYLFLLYLFTLFSVQWWCKKVSVKFD